MTDNRLDWAGLCWRNLSGWFIGTSCLAHCDEGHTYGRWCLLGPANLGKESSMQTYRKWKERNER